MHAVQLDFWRRTLGIILVQSSFATTGCRRFRNEYYRALFQEGQTCQLKLYIRVAQLKCCGFMTPSFGSYRGKLLDQKGRKILYSNSENFIIRWALKNSVMCQIILTIIKCQAVEVQSDLSWEKDLVHMLTPKNKIFKSKRSRNEVISDDQVMCPQSP